MEGIPLLIIGTNHSTVCWATDCAHLKVIDWGWYYLVTVIDDYSRFILARELKSDMAAGSLEEAIAAFIDYYNHRRYNEGLGNVMPYDIYTGRHLEILRKGKEAKTGHYRKEGIIIGLLGNSAMTDKCPSSQVDKVSQFR